MVLHFILAHFLSITKYGFLRVLNLEVNSRFVRNEPVSSNKETTTSKDVYISIERLIMMILETFEV